MRAAPLDPSSPATSAGNARDTAGRAAIVPTGGDVPPVLFLLDHIGYPSGVSHGLTSYLVGVLPALAQAGVELTVCCLREPHPAGDTLRERGIEPIFLGAGKLDPFVPARVAAIARKQGCRIIHAAQIKATLAARIAAPIVRARTILHVHDLNPVPAGVAQLHRLFSRRSDLALCVADVVHGLAVSGYSVAPDRVRTLHNSIDLERMRDIAPDTRSKLRAALGIASDAPAIGLVGRMFKVKGHRRMLEMMPAIAARFPDAVLLLVGDGPERAPCEALASDLGLAHTVRFLGQRSDVPELLAACDLVVLPSESEGLPLTAIEALAGGRPVVGFDVGGMREVVDDGSTGYLIEPGDAGRFVAAILSLLENPARMSAFGARAYAAADRFSMEHHVARLLALYGELALPREPLH